MRYVSKQAVLIRLAITMLMIPLVLLSISANAEEDRWQSMKITMFGDREIVTGDTVISLDLPKRAYDAAVVPLTVKVVNSEIAIKQVHLVVDMNPIPLAGIFKFSEDAGGWKSLETRIRVNEYTNIRAIAELEDGSLHMTVRFLKASGGCSAPAMADLDTAIANAGKMQVLIDSINDGTSEAVIKISHPNNSGMQFDQVSRNFIPAYFVHTIGAELNGKPMLTVETNFSLSENPMIRVNFANGIDAGEMLAYAVDSKGKRYQKSVESKGIALTLQ